MIKLIDCNSSLPLINKKKKNIKVNLENLLHRINDKEIIFYNTTKKMEGSIQNKKNTQKQKNKYMNRSKLDNRKTRKTEEKKIEKQRKKKNRKTNLIKKQK